MKSLQNLSYKTLFTILFFSLAGIIFFIRIGKPAQKVSAAWWDEMWHYRKAISIENSSGTDLTDFQVSISIGTSQLVADGKMQTDCDDIRITDINGNLLPYWIEENNPGCNQITDTKIWLKANSLPTSGATIYIYYGNQQADNNEDGNNVFELFDDFSTGFNNWSIFTGIHYGGTLVATINSGQLILTGTNAEGGIYKNNFATADGIVEFMARADQLRNGNDMGVIARRQSNTQYYDMGVNWGNNTTARIAKDAGHTNLASTSYTYGSGVFRLISGHFSGSSLKTYIDNNFKIGVTDTTYSSAGNVGIAMDAGHESGGLSVQWTIDNFRVRKYASADPNPSLQSEETGGGPIAYWKLDEGIGTTIYDSGSAQKNGYFGTTAPAWVDESQCISGKCLSFNGTQSVFSNYDLSWNNTNNISISFWIKPQNITDYNSGILGKQSTGYEWSIYQNNSNVSLVYWDNTGNHSNSMDDSWGSVLSPSNWTHLVYTWNGSTSNFYSNGKLVKTKIAANPAINNNQTNNMMLGGNIYTWGNSYFRGLIDEVKIYPYARTADQIKQDYNSRGSMSGAGVNLGVKSNTAPSTKSSLIAHYKFDEGNGTTINNSGSAGSSLNGFFGVGNSAPTWSNMGKFNKALSTNAPQFARVNTTPALNYTQDGFTYSAWIKATTLNTNYNMFMGQMLPYFNVYNSGGSDNRLHMSMNAGGGQQSVWGNTNTITTNQWYYVAATYDYQGYMKVYLDGKLDGTAGPYLVPYNYGSNLFFGTWETAGSYPFNGLIDEVKIYNRALTAEEIKQDYNSGSVIQFGSTNQTIGGTTTSLDYCIPGDTSECSAPVAEWNFEENTGTVAKDISGNNNTGTINNTTWTVGKKNTGAGLNFSGSSQYITIEDSTSLKPTTNVTVEAWFNTTNKTLNQRMVSKTNGGGYSLSVNENSACPANTLCFLININGSYYSASYPSSNLSNNTWYHAAGSYDGTTVRLFLNGSNIGTTASISNTITQNTAKLCIGSESAATNCYAENGFFSGKIDNVRIYNYARTPAQIAYDYNKGGPVGWWKFDECQGSTAFDSSGLGNTGVISIGQSGTQNTLGTCQTGTSAAWTNGASGKINSSLKLDGQDDYMTSPITVNGSNATIAFWVKNPTSGIGPYLLRSNAGVRTYITISGNTIGFMKGSPTAVGITGKTINPSEWNHVVLKWWTDNNGISYGQSYINGQALGTGSSFTDTTNGSYITLGGYTTTGTQNASGQFDDVRVYNYTLTSEQIKQVYNGGSVNFK